MGGRGGSSGSGEFNSSNSAYYSKEAKTLIKTDRLMFNEIKTSMKTPEAAKRVMEGKVADRERAVGALIDRIDGAWSRGQRDLAYELSAKRQVEEARLDAAKKYLSKMK